MLCAVVGAHSRSRGDSHGRGREDLKVLNLDDDVHDLKSKCSTFVYLNDLGAERIRGGHFEEPERMCCGFVDGGVEVEMMS